ncbi:uncharacterized protein KNAG_0A05180 [Huiozyma naganishii CBS 8797]|uniref:Uncharacterized protein n=1 Tax=Huiozyma naganishii (strain ATCC MYA-139 / BCRC 22969 / CBS 8797 / KCTC 17520 / NBRC 10181 / NCYC 3082 / Yp74L-3) TaxID=1071383 RepID=J7S2H8_HUIN7|nr:hypothetical protein KNAG_0A05180 [Kazachstania naganishii CBS 8797]CCK68184.1 hypothetical protein KNAG_0A05180 [Kazachstania naganishii CBS 8797]
MDPITFLLFKRDDDSGPAPACADTNEYDGRSNLRILSIFIILISSAMGSFFPILSSKYSFIRLPDWCFFLAKFFGSGVIVATAFVHLLQPANEALTDECLTGTFQSYPWAFGICLMSLFLLFLMELVSHYLIAKTFGHAAHDHSDFGNFVRKDSKELIDESDSESLHKGSLRFEVNSNSAPEEDIEENPHTILGNSDKMASMPGKGHYDHAVFHQDPAQLGSPLEEPNKEKYANQIMAVLFLEFGILFHSVFIGLSLAVAGDEFKTLFIVLVFHQMFEGLGLGTRIAETKWPENRRLTPWMLALGFTLTTPVAIAIGLGVRHSFIPGSRKALVSNGVFDSISSGILIYTGLVELMAHEFLYSNQFNGADGFKKMILAYVIMCFGVGLMALLGKWA